MTPAAERIRKPEPALPTETDSKLAAEASRTLSQSKPANGLRIRLDDNRELTIPQAAAQLLVHILTEMAEGNAVRIIPIHAELTTQEAADYLNVSRPFLIKLLETGKIPHHKTGAHRRVRFLDLANYKKQFETEREKLLDELVQSGQEMGLGY
jgi:excisionase family DNA binding protein